MEVLDQEKQTYYLVLQVTNQMLIKFIHMLKIRKAKYQWLISKRENTTLKCFNYSKASIEYSNAMIDIYKNIKII